MSIDENKKDTLFFRNFLYALDPRTCTVRYYNNGMSLNNIWMLRLLALTERILPRHPKIRLCVKSVMDIKKMLKFSKKKNKERIYEKKLLLELLNNSNEIRKYFSLKETTEIIEKEERIDKLHRILTLFMYMNHIEKMK